MKKIIKNTGILFLMALVLGSCNKWIDPDINIDPDNPTEVTMATLMPAIQARLAFTSAGGNDMVRTQAIWLQQLDGINRQSLAEANYQLRSSDVNNLWNATYAGHMMDIKKLIDYANASEPVALHFRGAGKVLMALTLGLTTDVWNDIPYTEALQGDDDLIKPKFDTQEEIYNTIFTLLNEGLADLGADDESPFPLGGDFFYNGDVSKWIAAAHGLLARYELHLSKRDNGAYAAAMGHLGAAIQSQDGNMQFNYGTGTTNSNPLFQFMRDRGDVRMGNFFVEMLKTRQDPRLPVYVALDGNDEYTGSVPGSANADASEPGPAVAAPDAPTYLVTYTEMLFIRAECMYQTGSSDAEVRGAIVDGLEASLQERGVYDEAYVAGYSATLEGFSGAALLAEIFNQKYIALFYQYEAYNDWRRSNNVIGLTPNAEAFEDEIPRRFPYSTDEIVYNGENVPTGITILDRVWWDQ